MRLTRLVRLVEDRPEEVRRVLQMGAVTHVIALHRVAGGLLRPVAEVPSLFPGPVLVEAVPEQAAPRLRRRRGARCRRDTRPHGAHRPGLRSTAGDRAARGAPRGGARGLPWRGSRGPRVGRPGSPRCGAVRRRLRRARGRARPRVARARGRPPGAAPPGERGVPGGRRPGGTPAWSTWSTAPPPPSSASWCPGSRWRRSSSPSPRPSCAADSTPSPPPSH